MIHSEIDIPTKYTQDAAAQINQVNKIIKQINFLIKFQLEQGYLTIREPCNQNLNPYLMIQYDKEAKLA